MLNTTNEENQAPREIKIINKKYLIGLVLGFFVFALAAGATTYYLKTKNKNNLLNNSSAQNQTSLYQEASTALNEIPNYAAIKTKYNLNLSLEQETFLDQNKFLLITRENRASYNYDQMLTDFDSIGGGSIYYRKPEDTKLVTPDIVLHAYHKYLENTLKKYEKNELSQYLDNFLTSLHENLTTAALNTSDQTIKERYQNLEAQIVLARILFENKNSLRPDYFNSPDEESAYSEQDKTIDSADNAKNILTKYSQDLPADLVEKIKLDIDSIYSADQIGVSPLFSQYNDELVTDYTQFTPRSHYNEDSMLRAYFRTMMYLGRSAYFLKKDIGILDTSLLVRQFDIPSKNGLKPIDDWNKIMQITGFFAGQSDDLTYTEWQDYQNKILGTDLNTSQISTPTSQKQLSEKLGNLRLPKILSDVIVDENIVNQTKTDLLRDSLAFRVFGQRFTFDAWILNELTAGQEKTDTRLPSTPSALFVPAAMGDVQAENYTKAFLKNNAGFNDADINSFQNKLNQKKSDIAKVKASEWFGSLGSAWLYVLGSLTHQYDNQYPEYMRNSAFADKQIQTFLGSYTELKHDTLLYAKQSYAELGGGGDDQEIPPVVKGFVEPNIDFWNRFARLIDYNINLFKDNNLGGVPLARLEEFQNIVNFYKDFAEQEFNNQPISDDDYEKLRNTRLSFMAEPMDNLMSEANEETSRVALIADIHTDALKNQILYEATGQPYLMLAIVANENTPRVVAGLAYNHYEFTGPIAQRLNDETWRQTVYQEPEKLPAKNFWYQSLLVK